MSKIRQRINIACENVAFYANNTWTFDTFYYQKCNETLCATIIKLRYLMAEETTKAPRTVRDVIPFSKLAEYSNYEYNESREMSYASQMSDISFYYPCLYKRDSMNEPWMLPEVEQMFTLLTYSKQFNLPKNYDEFYCTSNNNVMSSYMEFHEFKPIPYENFERTPGKTRFTVTNFLTDDDHKMVAYYLRSHMLSIDCFDDMMLKMKIRSDKVRNLWMNSKETIEEHNINKTMTVFKTPLDNYYVNDVTINNNDHNNVMDVDSSTNKVPFCFDDFRSKTSDFRKLQKLIDNVNNLRNRSTAQNNGDRIKTNRKIEHHLPAKRLYSDVVQGLSNKTSPIKSQTLSEITSPDNSSMNTINNETPILTPRTNTTNTTSNYITTTEDAVPLSQIVKSSQSIEFNCKNSNVTKQQQQQQPIAVINNTTKQNLKLAKDYCNNTANFNNNSANYLVSTIIDCNNPSDIYTTPYNNPYINSNVTNFYPNHQQYSSSTYQIPPYQSYSTNNSFIPITTYATNHLSSANILANSSRHQAATAVAAAAAVATNANSLQYNNNSSSSSNNNNNQTHNNYYLNQFRNIYLTPQPYFILQQPITKNNHRWMHHQHHQQQQQQHHHHPHHYHQTIRSNTPQNYTQQSNTNTNQYLTNPNVYNANHNQQIYTTSSSSTYHHHQQLYENVNNDTRQRSKPKKFLSTTQSKTIINKNFDYDVRTIKPITNNNNNNDNDNNVKNITGYYGDTLPPTTITNDNNSTLYLRTNADDTSEEYKLVLRKDNTINYEEDDNTYEDLEAQALNEYQSSNESFYKELEKEAVEQYEDNNNNNIIVHNDSIDNDNVNDNSENLTCPPNNDEYYDNILNFGGLLLIQNLLVLTINITNNNNYYNCLSIIRDIVT